jgi:hypothetical protein
MLAARPVARRLHAARAPSRSVDRSEGGGRAQPAGSGQPLETAERRRLEAGFGHDFSAVRVHTDPAAEEAARGQEARAFTIGRHVFFARGQYAPRTGEGERRLAHELAHVVQQESGSGPGRASAAAYGAAEREAERAAATVVAGGRARPRERTAGLVQRQEAGPTTGHSLGRPRRGLLADQPEPRLRLSPELEAVLLQRYLRWWLGTTLTTGAAPTGPDVSAPGGTGTGVPPPVASDPGAGMPLQPELFRPIRPGVLPGPDVGALMAPYGARGVPFGAREPDVALDIYRRNYRFVSLLPDLRDAAPGFVRRLIPGDWRSRIAGAFTAATIDAQLRHDFPTPIEAADRAFERMTGVSTTYIPLPGLSW